jgi:predicted lipoprotein with Yx(FWY)xxD motif
LKAWPLYGWVFDKAKGDVNGQAFNEVWWVLSPSGDVIRTQPTLRLRTNKFGTAGTSKAILVDNKGMTLYMYDRDISPNVSSCYDQCATAWPPLLVPNEAGLSIFQGMGIDKSKIKLIRRADTDKFQVAYNGWPLYAWARDAKIGDTTGQAVGNVWWVLDGSGTPLK